LRFVYPVPAPTDFAQSNLVYKQSGQTGAMVITTDMWIAPGVPGISKISIQTGTSHGGVPLPDGSIAQVKIDFDALQRCSTLARERYGMGGAVQHGASTLPPELFDRFPALGACEIHLATEFQNMIFDHPTFPAELKRDIYEELRTSEATERKPTDTDEQFFYKTRKKAIGPFKKRFWDLPADVKARLAKAYDEKFSFLFTQLAVVNTRDIVDRFVEPVELHRPQPHPDLEVVEAAPDDADLSD